MWKVYLESVYMFDLLLAARVRALVNAVQFSSVQFSRSVMSGSL